MANSEIENTQQEIEKKIKYCIKLLEENPNFNSIVQEFPKGIEELVPYIKRHSQTYSDIRDWAIFLSFLLFIKDPGNRTWQDFSELYHLSPFAKDYLKEPLAKIETWAKQKYTIGYDFEETGLPYSYVGPCLRMANNWTQIYRNFYDHIIKIFLNIFNWREYYQSREDFKSKAKVLFHQACKKTERIFIQEQKKEYPILIDNRLNVEELHNDSNINRNFSDLFKIIELFDTNERLLSLIDNNGFEEMSNVIQDNANIYIKLYFNGIGEFKEFIKGINPLWYFPQIITNNEFFIKYKKNIKKNDLELKFKGTLIDPDNPAIANFCGEGLIFSRNDKKLYRQFWFVPDSYKLLFQKLKNSDFHKQNKDFLVDDNFLFLNLDQLDTNSDEFSLDLFQVKSSLFISQKKQRFKFTSPKKSQSNAFLEFDFISLEGSNYSLFIIPRLFLGTSIIQFGEQSKRHFIVLNNRGFEFNTKIIPPNLGAKNNLSLVVNIEQFNSDLAFIIDNSIYEKITNGFYTFDLIELFQKYDCFPEISIIENQSMKRYTVFSKKSEIVFDKYGIISKRNQFIRGNYLYFAFRNIESCYIKALESKEVYNLANLMEQNFGYVENGIVSIPVISFEKLKLEYPIQIVGKNILLELSLIKYLEYIILPQFAQELSITQGPFESGNIRIESKNQSLIYSGKLILNESYSQTCSRYKIRIIPVFKTTKIFLDTLIESFLNQIKKIAIRIKDENDNDVWIASYENFEDYSREKMIEFEIPFFEENFTFSWQNTLVIDVCDEEDSLLDQKKFPLINFKSLKLDKIPPIFEINKKSEMEYFFDTQKVNKILLEDKLEQHYIYPFEKLSDFFFILTTNVPRFQISIHLLEDYNSSLNFTIIQKSLRLIEADPNLVSLNVVPKKITKSVEFSLESQSQNQQFKKLMNYAELNKILPNLLKSFQNYSRIKIKGTFFDVINQHQYISNEIIIINDWEFEINPLPFYILSKNESLNLIVFNNSKLNNTIELLSLISLDNGDLKIHESNMKQKKIQFPLMPNPSLNPISLDLSDFKEYNLQKIDCVIKSSSTNTKVELKNIISDEKKEAIEIFLTKKDQLIRLLDNNKWQFQNAIISHNGFKALNQFLDMISRHPEKYTILFGPKEFFLYYQKLFPWKYVLPKNTIPILLSDINNLPFLANTSNIITIFIFTYSMLNRNNTFNLRSKIFSLLGEEREFSILIPKDIFHCIFDKEE